VANTWRCPACAGWAPAAPPSSISSGSRSPLSRRPNLWVRLGRTSPNRLDSSVPTRDRDRVAAHSTLPATGPLRSISPPASVASTLRTLAARRHRPGRPGPAPPIAIAVGLAWQGHTPSRKGQIPQIARVNHPTPTRVPSAIKVLLRNVRGGYREVIGLYSAWREREPRSLTCAARSKVLPGESVCPSSILPELDVRLERYRRRNLDRRGNPSRRRVVTRAI